MNPQIESKRAVKIDDKEYIVTAIPVEYAPLSKLIAQLMSKDPENVDAAIETQRELEKAINKVLEVTIGEEVPKEHRIFVYQCVTNLTNDLVAAAEFFRSQPDSPNSPSS